MKNESKMWRLVRLVAECVRRNPYCAVVIVLLAIVLWLWYQGHPQAVLAATIVPGVAGGKHVVDGPLTTELSREASPSLLLNEVDRQIVKIRPMATPVDQISRYAGAKHAGAMQVDYYNVDTKPTTALMADDYDETTATSTGSNKVCIETDNDEIFDTSDTILVQGVYGYEADGQTRSRHELVLYVTGRDSSNGLMVMAVNGKRVGGIDGCVPSIEAGTTLVRMGRAASELDVMSPQFEAMPTKDSNLCQIFKMQVEESTLHKMANKETDWTMSDQEEAAIYDMRLGMEKSFLFGVKQRLWNPDKKEYINLTGGIWHQAGKDFRYDTEVMGENEVVELMRMAFTGNNGSKRKVLIGGSKLIGALSHLDVTRVVRSGETVSKWGIDFTELRSKFGTLYLLLSEVFDDCGMAENGLVVDPEYIQKYSHVPFSTEALNLKSSGLRNTDALVLTEASCLVLRYPKAHMRIVKV
ncbi:MAG: DUF5309 family protein [Muribaculaceae bacterium]|nr:DUF5309 family protein [Muribaculaceae bacterium]